MADLLAVLYTSIFADRSGSARRFNRDRFILSKGHATAILYAVLAERVLPARLAGPLLHRRLAADGPCQPLGVPGVERRPVRSGMD